MQSEPGQAQNFPADCRHKSLVTGWFVMLYIVCIDIYFEDIQNTDGYIIKKLNEGKQS